MEKLMSFFSKGVDFSDVGKPALKKLSAASSLPRPQQHAQTQICSLTKAPSLASSNVSLQSQSRLPSRLLRHDVRRPTTLHDRHQRHRDWQLAPPCDVGDGPWV